MHFKRSSKNNSAENRCILMLQQLNDQGKPTRTESTVRNLIPRLRKANFLEHNASRKKKFLIFLRITNCVFPNYQSVKSVVINEFNAN